MTDPTAPPPEQRPEQEPKPDSGQENPEFDPYRFGPPDHPVPPEYAPPGYQTTGYQPPAPPPAPPQPPQAPSDPFAAQLPPSNYPGYPGYPSQPTGYPPPGYPPAGYGQQPGYPPAPGYPTAPGYPPAPQGYPAPPAYHHYPQPSSGGGKAVAALVLGVLSILFCWTSVLDLVVIIPGLILSIMAMSDARQGRGSHTMARAGLITTIVGIVFAIVLTIVYINIANNIDCSVYHSPGSFSYGFCQNRTNS